MKASHPPLKRYIGLKHNPSTTGITLVILFLISVIIPKNELFGHVSDQFIQISGVVTSAQTNEPLEFVRVQLVSSDKVWITDKSGRFTISIPQYNDVTIQFSMVGYETLRVNPSYILGFPNNIEIQLHPSISMIDEVVITSSPTGSGVQYQSAQAFNRAEITQRKDVTVGHMLDGEPGVAMRSFGPAPSRPVIRGLDGERILILENGERMGDISESAADHAVALDPGAMNRIEIVRGPASLLYGNSAMGGVINLITNDIPQDWSIGAWGSISGNASTVNSLGMSSARFGYGNEHRAITGRGSIRGAGDIRTPEGRISGTGLSAYEGSIGLGFRNDKIQGGVTIMGMNSGFGIPGNQNDPNRIEIRFQRTALQYRLDAKHDGFFDKFQLKGHLSIYDQQEVDIQNVEGSEFEQIPLTYGQKSLSSTLYLQHRPIGILERGVVGLNVNGRIMDVGGFDAYTPGDQYLNIALFTFQEVSLSERTRLQTGIRLDSRSIKARFQNVSSSIDSRTVNTDIAGSVGLNFRPTSSLEAGIQFAKAHRYPTIEELYSNGAHLGAGSYERGNPNLGTESGYGLDLFVRKNYGNWVSEIAGYSMWIENFIRFEPTGEVDIKSGFPVFEYISGSARLIGGEFQIRGQFGQYWTLTSSADIVVGDVSGIDGHPLPSIPPVRINNRLRYDNSGFWGQIQLKNVFTQDRVAPGELPTDGYTLLGAAVGFQFGDTQYHRLILRLDNVLNTSYQDHLSKIEDRGQLMPGRNLSLIYTLDF